MVARREGSAALTVELDTIQTFCRYVELTLGTVRADLGEMKEIETHN